MSERRLSSFLGQAVNGTLSFETLLTLLKIASEKDCHRVRYLQPPPQDFGAFIAPPDDFKPFDFRTMAMREPEDLTINQLCEASYVVVKKIAEYHNEKEAALKRASDAERAERQAKRETERVTELLQQYAPQLFTYSLDDDYLP